MNAASDKMQAMILSNESGGTVTNSVNLFDIPIQVARMADVLYEVNESIRSRESLNIGVVNAAKVVNMRRDPELAKSVLSSDVIYADGMSVVWASRILGRELPERIAGIDLMEGILRDGKKHGYRVFCLGATAEVVDKVCESFVRDYPGIVIAGHHDGYFNDSEEADVAALIKDANADILFVAIPSPKKEKFMAKWSAFMDVPVVHGVGGSFDVVAGLVNRAPDAWQRMGLEWLYRVKQEPRRLWKRYLVTNLSFLMLVAKERLRLFGATR